MQQPSLASQRGAAGTQPYLMSLHRKTEALCACADFETATGHGCPIPAPVVQLMRQVYAQEAGQAGLEACMGLNTNQVSWAWAVVSSAAASMAGH